MVSISIRKLYQDTKTGQKSEVMLTLNSIITQGIFMQVLLLCQSLNFRCNVLNLKIEEVNWCHVGHIKND